MPLLTEYDKDLVVFHCFGDEEKATDFMFKAITLYWPKRKNKIARSRIKSACKIIRSIKSAPAH